MTAFLRIFTLTFVFVSFSCCNTTKANTITNTEKIQNSTENYKRYKGIIIHSTAEGDCEYVIALADDKSVMFDPVNLQGNFKTHGTRVWFTFRSLKMPNRCEKANPINIISIEERALEKTDKPSKE
ncbi:hypothetical protein O4H26_12680 [Aequorivita viscosa]|nr:hypothetical protein [Aequorivita viscosa]